MQKPITLEDLYQLINTGNNEIKQEIRDLKSELTAEIEQLKARNKELEEQNKSLQNKLLQIERQTKKYNVIVYGIEEGESQPTDDVLNLLNRKLKINCNKNDFRNIYRIGKRNEDKIRPIALETVNYELKIDILQKAKSEIKVLKEKKISIVQDYTSEDYKIRKYLTEHLKAVRAKHYKAIIKNHSLIVNGEEYSYDYLKNVNPNSDFILENAPVSLQQEYKERKLEVASTKETGTIPKKNTRAQQKKCRVPSN